MKTTMLKIGLTVGAILLAWSLVAQEIEVSGTVYDALDKSPLVGVTVTVKGSRHGTITDTEGNYRIKKH